MRPARVATATRATEREHKGWIAKYTNPRKGNVKNENKREDQDPLTRGTINHYV